MKPITLLSDQHLVDAYIERNDMQPVAEDIYEDAGGGVWHIEDIVTQLQLETVGES